jgi:hypothetical protein
MKLTTALKERISNLYNSTSDNIISVGLGRKTKNGVETGEIGIVFGVLKKIPINDLPKDEILPRSIFVNGEEYQTDVEETEIPKMLACYASGDPEIARLQNLATAPSPLKGGQEITMYPNYFTPDQRAIGTLGFIGTDNIDGKIVAVTNAHAAVYKALIASQRDFVQEESLPYNTVERYPLYDNSLQYPSGVMKNNATFVTPFPRIKRYVPFYKKDEGTNYVDVAIYSVLEEYINNDSYQVWQPTTVTSYPPALPFATKAELDNLLVTNPLVYSTGRTTGPKGYGSLPSCRLKITQIGILRDISVEFEAFIGTWFDVGIFKFEDNSPSPVIGGDSGSSLLADIGGQRKIIGLVFAGGGNLGVFCRIDRIVEALNISAFSTPTNTQQSEPSLFTGSISQYANTVKLTRNGKTYYQVGLTRNTYNG